MEGRVVFTSGRVAVRELAGVSMSQLTAEMFAAAVAGLQRDSACVVATES